MMFDITVGCVINTAYASVILPTGTFTDAADIMRQIRYTLMQPRKTLSVKFNGTELIPAKAGVPGTVDAANGPQPKSCTCTMLTNTTFLMTYRIMASYWQAGTDSANNPAGSPVLYNRWTESVSINDCNYTTRSRRGKYIIRSDNSTGSTADELRTQFAVVGVPPGFLRTKSEYTVDPSGLGLEYSIEDKEQFKMPPSPAFKASGYYMENTTKFNARRYGTVQVTLEGSKTTSQTTLVNAAVLIATRKLSTRIAGLAAGLGAVTNFIESASVNMDLYENKVTCNIKCYLSPTNKRIANAVSAFYDMDDTTPGSDPAYTPPYLDRGSAGILLEAAAYYDPNLAANGLNPAGQMNAGKVPGEAGANP